MRYCASEKFEIIELVEQSSLSVPRTLAPIGIPRSTFYDWYSRYQEGGIEALEDGKPRPRRIWNKIPDKIETAIVNLALEKPDLSPRELVVNFTDTKGSFVSEATVYRLLKATRTVARIFAIAGDPVGTGLVGSLARPGGNITGLSNMGAETGGKCLELFRDMLPSLRRVGVLANPVDPFSKSIVEQIQVAGRTAGIDIGPIVMVRGLNDVEAGFSALARDRADALVVPGIFFANTIADLAIRYRLPSASVLRSFADAGGLMSYGADIPHMYRRSAVFVHKILQGTKPADLPVEQPTKFELVINLKTAKAIGLDVPIFLQQRADEVIE